jgi:hypothetical protein
MDEKLASAWFISAPSRHSCCAGASETKAGASGDAWQPHCVRLPDSTQDCALHVSIAAMEHPDAQQVGECAFCGHEIAPDKGAAPRTTKSSVATTLDKNLMPVE